MYISYCVFCLITGVIFCVGGRGSSGDPFKSIECYDVRGDRWFQVADMSCKRRHVGVVSADGMTFILAFTVYRTVVVRSVMYMFY